jgi:hypothetical protein
MKNRSPKNRCPAQNPNMAPPGYKCYSFGQLARLPSVACLKCINVFQPVKEDVHLFESFCFAQRLRQMLQLRHKTEREI